MIDGSDQIYQGGDGTALRFFYAPAKNNFQSEKAGRAVFDTVLYMEVITPGSTESMPQFEVERTLAEEAGKGADGQRMVKRGAKYAQYVQQVEAFKAQNGEHLSSGTPITQWAQIDVGTAASLKAAGIHTVEMLASVSDGHLQNLGTGGRVLRDQAIAHINTRQFGVPTAQMAAETANLREENVRLQTQLTDAQGRLTAALAEVQALRTGDTSRLPENSTLFTDPLGTLTPSQPNTGASMENGAPNPLTPGDGKEIKDNAKAAGLDGLSYQPQQFQSAPVQPPSPIQQGQGAPAVI